VTGEGKRLIRNEAIKKASSQYFKGMEVEANKDNPVSTK
jgi:hypothetical protein